MELDTHPLADLHLSGTAHLALNSRVSLTARSQSWAGDARGLRLLTQVLGSSLGSCEQESRDAVPQPGAADPPRSPAGELVTVRAVGCIDFILEIALITGFV